MQTFDSPGYRTNGSTQVVDGCLRLTNDTGQSGSAWLDTLINPDRFTATFDLELKPRAGAGWGDGFSFAITDAAANDDAAIGSGGVGLGYGGLSRFAVEFDTFQNAEIGDPGYAHVGLDVAGNPRSVATSGPLPFEIRGTGTVTATVTCDHGAVAVFLAQPGGPQYRVLTGTVPISLPSTGRVGFTGSTGGAAETALVDRLGLSRDGVPLITQDFASPGYQTNGSAHVAGGGLRLTDNLGQAGSAWFDPPVATDGFTAAFDFRLSEPRGQGWGDGFTFAVVDPAANDPLAVGSGGFGLGYAGLSGFAVEFDTYQNPEYGDPDALHVGLDLGGSVRSAVVRSLAPFEIRDAGTVTAEITYGGGSLQVFLTKAGTPKTLVLAGTVPERFRPAAGRVGFTGSTGSAAQTTVIDNFRFSPPIALDDAATTDEDTTVPIDVLANDSDRDGDPLTIGIVAAASHGTAVVDDNGTPANPRDDFVRYTPDRDSNGPDRFTYKVNDGAVDSDVATVTISVNPVNDAPSFTNGSDQATTDGAESHIVPGWATAISAGPPDEAAQHLSFVVTVDNGSLFTAPPAIDATGVLRYTPAEYANGTATVTVTLHDDGGIANGGSDTSAPQTFTITVSARPLAVVEELFRPAMHVAGEFQEIAVAFNRPIDASSFTSADVLCSGPNGQIPITEITRLSPTIFRIQIPLQTTKGVYQVHVGPEIRDVTGKQMDEDRDGRDGEPVDDVFSRLFEIVRTPVLIVPGILGSMPEGTSLATAPAMIPALLGNVDVVNGQITLKPLSPLVLVDEQIGGTYSTLIASFEKEGYHFYDPDNPGLDGDRVAVGPESDLFFATYDWRLPVLLQPLNPTDPNSGVKLLWNHDGRFESGVEYLDWWIEQAKAKWVERYGSADGFAVDLVAHSMGGLLARAYIQEAGAAGQTPERVNHLIMLGTPNHGSVKTYQFWDPFPRVAGEPYTLPEIIAQGVQDAAHGAPLDSVIDALLRLTLRDAITELKSRGGANVSAGDLVPR